MRSNFGEGSTPVHTDIFRYFTYSIYHDVSYKDRFPLGEIFRATEKVDLLSTCCCTSLAENDAPRTPQAVGR